VRNVKPRALSADGKTSDYDELIERIGDARVVLLGAASDGAQESYRERCRISKRLIEEHDFKAVATEADWSDAYRVNRYVQGAAEDNGPEQALRGFCRFPTWVWRNAEVLSFVSWLREHNDGVRREGPVGFHGLDLYSFYRAAATVIDYLDSADPEAAERARRHYAHLGCFDAGGKADRDGGFAIRESDGRKIVAQLIERQLCSQSYLRRNGTAAEDIQFYTEQHERLWSKAESYYRTLISDRDAAWRQREHHMAETLAQLLDSLEARGDSPRVVVWAHNSHVGDARHTEMGERGEVSIGQLARQRWPGEVALIGLTNYAGTITASPSWQGAVQRMRLRPALESSYEAVFHKVDEPRFYLDLRHAADPALRAHRIQRGIGVIYRAEDEFPSHFFSARIAGQFDAVSTLDEATAGEALDRDTWVNADAPDASPSSA
jgi:erythromycin esterase-like protein